MLFCVPTELRHKCGVICMSEVIDISPGNLDPACASSSPVFLMMYSAMEVVKQQMARVNVNILGISELEWVNLTQMTIISTTAGRNPSEKME